MQHFKDAIYVGHGINQDLKVLALSCELLYVDTAWFEEGRYDSHIRGQVKKLKELVKTYLNAMI